MSPNGDLEGLYKTLTKEERFQAAIDIASAISDMHFSGERKSIPAIAHADISAKQFLQLENGHFVLNDFNRARLLQWNKETETICPFHIKVNKGKVSFIFFNNNLNIFTILKSTDIYIYMYIQSIVTYTHVTYIYICLYICVCCDDGCCIFWCW